MKAYSTFSDTQLLGLLNKSDHSAYMEVYYRYFDPVFRHAFKKLRNEEAARDIVQDVFVNLWVKRSTYAIGPNLGGYLFTAVRNRIFNFWAHEKVESAYWESFIDDIGTERYADAPTDHRIRERQLMEYINRQVEAFSPRMREVFELSRKQHLSHREIAEQLNTTEDNVAKQIGNALRILRAKMGILIFWILIILVNVHYIFLKNNG
ncbi:RNA polymerase sigma-70 factor (ECF subfamily) [Mucilaginibacter sp. SG538B]|uniref:RNA polymerase sigma-70 factor n=1 Tax=Mucilaginibacter sp. SG538B TaxID=2587021 RepID=UPI00159D3F44|nr:RNA polymerase sigma-70 factor [Mucilaginibacter sp. SG538B]NVM66897.1 RNA polymerase sigma-70 factor (ECF subfamily) [Mucilaginibacter sp. SG538B]